MTERIDRRAQVRASVEKAYVSVGNRYETEKTHARVKLNGIMQEWADGQHEQLFDAKALTKLAAETGGMATKRLLAYIRDALTDIGESRLVPSLTFDSKDLLVVTLAFRGYAPAKEK